MNKDAIFYLQEALEQLYAIELLEYHNKDSLTGTSFDRIQRKKSLMFSALKLVEDSIMDYTALKDFKKLMSTKA